mmetsp:Transcript_5545/g.12779  ORF Transcript_5545/g.12779 Transcript_5545/m.12779 type:complete len:206 (-) Transcript_5545:102-719(-)
MRGRDGSTRSRYETKKTVKTAARQPTKAEGSNTCMRPGRRTLFSPFRPLLVAGRYRHQEVTPSSSARLLVVVFPHWTPRPFPMWHTLQQHHRAQLGTSLGDGDGHGRREKSRQWLRHRAQSWSDSGPCRLHLPDSSPETPSSPWIGSTQSGSCYLKPRQLTSSFLPFFHPILGLPCWCCCFHSCSFLDYCVFFPAFSESELSASC